MDDDEKWKASARRADRAGQLALVILLAVIGLSSFSYCSTHQTQHIELAPAE